MRLKRLEINGFKSFVDKTQIIFPEGICAIVGPNGCGKSNIIDALLWVMGEQSVKKLRGKSMEDMIFAGTSDSRSFNFAEVNLTLANYEGVVSDELDGYSEVMLTRRLHRSGESEYFLNKRPCRLKDIHNIFEKSGGGHKTYSIITQGNIGAIIDAGPEERRLFIEEAASITGYKTRKIEAIKKIDAAKQNLLRLTDVISEVKRQMTSLKRQAKKAKLFKEYMERIKVLEVLISLFNYDRLLEDIERDDALLADLNDSELKNSSELSKFDAACQKIKLDRERKEKELSENKDKRFEIRRKIDGLENDLIHIQKDYQNITSSLGFDKDSETELMKKNGSMLSEIEDSQNTLSDLDSKIMEMSISVTEEENKAKDTIELSLKLKKRLEEHKSELMRTAGEEARIKNVYHTAVTDGENLDRRLKNIEAEKKKAGITKERFVARVGEAEKKKALSEDEIESLSEKIERSLAILEEKKRKFSEQIKKVSVSEMERERLKSEYSALKKIRDDFRWYKDGVRAIMKSFKNGKTDDRNITGLIADVIDPEPGFEIAVEAVLGDALQYIFVKDRKDSFEYIDFLIEKKSGRSGFIPFSSIGIPDEDNETKLTKLIDHVGIKEGFENICRILFQNIYVSETIEEAAVLWDKEPGKNIFVTKNGEVISEKGIIIGGSGESLSDILIKKRDIAAVEKRIKEIEFSILSEKEMLSLFESEFRISEKNMQRLMEEKNKAVSQKQEAEKSLYMAEEDLKHALRHLEIIDLEQERLIGERSDIDDEIGKHNEAVIVICKKMEDIKALAENTASEIERISFKAETFNRMIVDKKLEITSLKTKRESEASSSKRLSMFYEEGKKALAVVSEKIIEKTEKLNILEKDIHNGKKELALLYDNLRRIEQSIETFEDDYHSINSALEEKNLEIDTLKSESEKRYQKIRYIELEQSQRKIKCENIDGRIKERYHKDLSELKESILENSFDYKVENEAGLSRLEDKLTELKEKIAAGFGDVNLRAIEEYEELKTRYDFLATQQEDINKAIDDLYKVVKKINNITREKFKEAFDLINDKISVIFPKLFEGGSAKLILTEPDNILETGVEFMVHPPGKKLTLLMLLSGGEKALCAVAFIFSIFLIKHASFCLLDEIDAPLDESNIFRFNELLKIVGEKTQIIMVTHNKRSMEFADTLFGVTMGKKGVSNIVSVAVD